jgi:parvulin-like peptidyl-prolyl isomerase
MKRFFMLMVAAAILSFSPAFAENAQITNMQILIDKVKADKKLLIASNMDLTDKESKDFWPLYNGYQQDLEQLNRHLGGLIYEYAEAYNKGSVSDDLAKSLINEALKTEGAEVKMRREYAEKLTKVLPATKVARYLQMENKIRAAIKFDLAANIPLMY